MDLVPGTIDAQITSNLDFWDVTKQQERLVISHTIHCRSGPLMNTPK
jgi:hypothetical protein